MNKLLLSAIAGLALSPLAGRGAAASYINPVYGYVTTAPMIDATNFVNFGTFAIGTTAPFETWDTLNYTNLGNLLGSSGWRFNTLSTRTGLRSMARSFVNDDAGIVQAEDSGGTFYVPPPPCTVASVIPSYLWISATNIISRGLSPASLIVDADGWLDLNGTNIDLTRSGTEVTPVWVEAVRMGLGDSTVTVNNVLTWFIPDLAIPDLYSVTANFTPPNFTLASDALWDGTVASAPAIPNPATSTAFNLQYPVADSYINIPPRSSTTITLTNFTGPATNVTATNVLIRLTLVTNVFKGAAFTHISLPINTANVGFSGSASGFETAGALLSTYIPNSVTAAQDPAYLWAQDTLATTPRLLQLSNLVGCPLSGTRPANYSQNRLPNSAGSAGNNGYPQADFFTAVGYFDGSSVLWGGGVVATNAGSDAVTNATVSAGLTTAYSSFFDNIVSRPEAIAAGTVSNMPGRITIHAQKLDMTDARLRAEGLISIQADTVTTSTNTITDVENLNFDLNSTNGTVNIHNLATTNVARFRGPNLLWSALWTNYAQIIFTNNFVFSNIVVMSGTNIVGTNIQAFAAPLTNLVQINFHVFMLDGDELVSSVPVNVYNVTSHATNTVLTDSMSVAESFLVQGQSLTLNGDFSFAPSYPANPVTGTVSPITPPQSWTAANAPNLLYFTNNGIFSVPNEAHFGDDRPKPYLDFVNGGTISALSINVASSYFQLNGNVLSQGPLFLTGGIGKLENGSGTASGVAEFLAGSVKFNKYRLTSASAIFFNVTNSLFDAGPGSGNTITATYGFNLQRKPPLGDLLGTTLKCTAPPFYSVQHTWAATDRGATPAGYSNNVAVGMMTLGASDTYGRHFIQGTGTSNALYVDLLDLSGLKNIQTQLALNPNLVLYYAAANVSFTPPPNAYGVAQEPEEYLNGQLGGHLVWVSSYAGPNSSVSVVSNGVSIVVNRALRFSKIIDSNGDGIPNYYDPNPFGMPAPALNVSLVATNKSASLGVAVSWLAAPNTVYQVEYTTNMPLANWQPLLKYTNNSPASRMVTIVDPSAPASTRRFYRVGYKN